MCTIYNNINRNIIYNSSYFIFIWYIEMKTLGKAEWYEESIVCKKCKEILLYNSEDKKWYSLIRLCQAATIICKICGNKINIPVD